MRKKPKQDSLMRVYWEAGIWRRYSWEEFIKGLAEILSKNKQSETTNANS